MAAGTQPGRTCGPCTACCRALSVPELKKDAWQVCAHVCPSGCGVYDHRPASCRAFQCQWLRGLLEADDTLDVQLRPDACGVIFDFQPGTAYGDIYTAWEMEPDAADRGRARDVIEGLARRFPVMIVSPDPNGEDGGFARRFVGP